MSVRSASVSESTGVLSPDASSKAVFGWIPVLLVDDVGWSPDGAVTVISGSRRDLILYLAAISAPIAPSAHRNGRIDLELTHALPQLRPSSSEQFEVPSLVPSQWSGSQGHYSHLSLPSFVPGSVHHLSFGHPHRYYLQVHLHRYNPFRVFHHQHLQVLSHRHCLFVSVGSSRSRMTARPLTLQDSHLINADKHCSYQSACHLS